MKIKNLFINEDLSIKETIKKLDQTAKKILIVTQGSVLKGVVTDGDIRRWILKNGDLCEKVNLVMNNNPIYLTEKERHKAIQLMKKRLIEAVPIVNERKEVVDIVFWSDNFEEKLNHFNKIENPIVIMAGGKGARLYPFTKILPKPLIPIGDIPIVERIINRFREYGCRKFYLTVNYKKNIIKAYFDDLQRDYDIYYVEEEKPLGTAGSLHMLKNIIEDTFFISNCDILIDGNYSDMLKYHKENHNKITMITSLKHYTIPYGVIKLNGEGAIIDIFEKPEYDFLVNTGMYILEPEVLNAIPEGRFYNMTDLISDYIEKGERVGTYPVSDKSWLDMGQFKEMEIMLERLGFK